VEPGQGCAAYDKMIFGQFLEHFHRQVYGGVFEPGSKLSDERGFRLDVVQAVRELSVPVVRWPGGCFVSAYHWKDGVGADRRPAYDKAWGVEESNAFGTDEFVSWCRLIGAEPYICTNAGTGTPEEMSDWVEYCNLPSAGHWARLRRASGHDEPHAVRFWSIGNENYGDWEMGAKTRDEWGPFVRESAKMMKRADPSIELFAAAVADEDWTLRLLQEAGPYLDYVSIHGYWDFLVVEDSPADYAACIGRSNYPEVAIQKTRDIIAKAGYERRVAIAFDEWNLRSWHHPGNSERAIAARDRNDINSTYTMADAVFSACFLNSCLRNSDVVRMANMSPIINTRGPLYVHPKGLVKRTTYHVMAMYANLLEECVSPAVVESQPFTVGETTVPELDAVATCDDEAARWRLALVNRHPDRPLPCAVKIDDRPLRGPCRATVLEGDSTDAFNDVDAPDRVVPNQRKLDAIDGSLVLPPHSVSIVEVDLNQG
jgi:alpha-N-arabinofuranosidase